MRALILGGAANVHDDAKAALELFTPDLVLAVNDIGTVWPGPIDAYCSLHPEKFPAWLATRAANGHAPPGSLWTSEGRQRRATLPVRTVRCHGGGSGMLAVKVARELGATHIVLAGMPMAHGYAHFHDPKPWFAARLYQRFWVRDQGQLRIDTRSMSGLTRELLGYPTQEWLAHGTEDQAAVA